MIKSFLHKGLKRFYQTGSTVGINAQHKDKIRVRLSALDTALKIDDLNLPSFDLHPLKGNRKNPWSISVNDNWRITFEFENGNIYIINYEDYH